MTEFYPLRHNHMTSDFTLLKQLELKQHQLEERAGKQPCRFHAHPKLIQSDSDTTTTCTPRVMPQGCSSSSDLQFSSRKPFQETKQRAQNFHKLLHEKLSIIDKSDTAPGITNTSSSSSEDSDDLDCKCKEFQFKRRPSGAPRDTKRSASASERKSASSRLSSQQSGNPSRGITPSVFENKFKVLVTKCSKSMSDIREILTKGIEPPDGDEDESRRVTRLKEFSNRFSRNYLYPLGRQLKDLSSLDQIAPVLVNQKLLSTYQVVTNALQAYQTHLPTSIGSFSFNQLKVLMNGLIEVSDIHRKQVADIEENYILEFIDTLKVNAELTVQKVEECVTKPPPDGALKSEQSRISLTKYGGNPKSASRKRTKLEKRLSMYTVTASFRKDVPWKRAVESLARKKFDVKSKYKTATYKHRPPVQKLPEEGSVFKLRALMHPRQSGMLRTSRVELPMNEDCIKTMVESDRNEENAVEKEVWENMEKNTQNPTGKEEVLMKLLQYALQAHGQGPSEEDNKSQIADILNLLKSDDRDDFLKKILDSLGEGNAARAEQDRAQQLTLEIVKSHYSLSDGVLSERAKTQRKEPTVTVSGEKNARLICITDDNSVTEPPPEETQRPPDKDVATIAKTSSETQTDIRAAHRKTSKSTQKGRRSPSVKISRLKKSGRLLRPLDKKTAVHAIQYKLDFYRFCKTNPMYKRSTACQPWALMNRISEELLNQSLLSVAREIEVNDVVEGVFQAELQL